MAWRPLDRELGERLHMEFRSGLARAITPMLLGGNRRERRERKKDDPQTNERAMALALVMLEFSASLFQNFLLKGAADDGAEEAFLEVALESWRVERKREQERQGMGS